jgi:hypothetical protein
MTKKIIILNAILVLIFTSTYGQKDTLNKKDILIIKTDLINLSLNAFGVVNLGSITIEKGFLNRHSFQLTAGYLKYINFKSKSWTLLPEYKFYINKKNNFKGFYTGLYLKYTNEVSLDLYSWGSGGDKYITKKYQNYGSGLTIGYQTYFKKHLTLDFLLGFGGLYKTRQINIPADYYLGSPSYNIDNKYPAIFPDARASIFLGYKF